jgi:hypothetical protein
MLIWFCDGMIFGDKIPLFRDLGSYFYPIKFVVAQALKAGELPLWDRHMAGGFPVMAGLQSAVFYPPTLLFAVLPFFGAIQVSFVFHYAVAGFGSYALFRWWKCPIHVALIGSILFTFGGTVVSLSNLVNHFQTAVWLPLVILYWERTLKLRFWREFVCLSFVLLFQLLSGSPEIFLFSIGILIIDAIRLVGEREIVGIKKPAAILIAAIVVVTGLGMVQWLPTGELISLSRRDQPIPAAEAFAWSLRPSGLIDLIVPTLETDSALSLGIRLLLSNEVPFLLSHYLGAIALLGVCSWFGQAGTKERLILGGFILISVFLALGSNTPAYPFVYSHVPLLRIIRFPEKFFFLTFVLLLFAAIRGLAKIEIARHERWPSLLAVVILIGWSSLYIFLRWKTSLLIRLLESPGETNLAMPVTAPTLAGIFFNLEKQIAVSLIYTGLFVLYRGMRLNTLLFRFMLVLTTFVDLSVAHKPLQFLREKELISDVPRVLDKPPLGSRLFYYPPGNNLHPSYMSVYGNLSFDKATQLPFNNLLPNAGILFGFEYFQDIDALSQRSYNDFLYFANALPREKRAKLLGAMNIRYVISFRRLEVPGFELLRETPEHFSWLYEIPVSVPRVYVVTDGLYEPEPLRLLNRLIRDDFDPLRQVVLDTPRQLQPAVNLQSELFISKYQNSHVQIRARLSAPGILVLTDSYYPGWKVFVDGAQKKLLRANHFFRAVELPAGNHSVEFVYDPLSFKIGSLISLLTAALLIAVPVVGWLRRRAALRQSRSGRSQAPLSSVADR